MALQYIIWSLGVIDKSFPSDSLFFLPKDGEYRDGGIKGNRNGSRVSENAFQ